MANTRSQRSWHKLAEAQIELLLQQPDKSPTVEQVLQRAGVARATFYRHFRDLDSLLAWQVEHLLDTIGASIDWSSYAKEELFNGRVVRALLEHAQARPDLFHAYVGTAQVVNARQNEAGMYAHKSCNLRKRPGTRPAWKS